MSTTNLLLLLLLSDSVKKMTAGTVTRPAPSPPPSICSSSLEMVATEMSLVLEVVLAALLVCQRADWSVMPLMLVWVSAFAWSVELLALRENSHNLDQPLQPSPALGGIRPRSCPLQGGGLEHQNI